MNKYPKYKPSGVEWIGEIPEHWNIKRLKYFLSSNDGGVWGDDYDGISENATKVFRSTEINIDGSWNFDEEPALRVLSGHEKEKALLKEGDLLVTKSSGSQLHIGKTALVTNGIEGQNCCYSNFMQRLRPLNIEASMFLHIFLNSNLARDQYNYLSNSTTGLANLSSGLLNDVLLPSPRLEEQTAIASYLDKKTAQIDTLISNKQKLIELLKEERTAIINRAVTRGIDPKVKLKPSGIDWLGDIPEHWEVKKLKYVGKTIIGIIYNPSEITNEEDGILVLRASNIKNGRISYEDNVYVKKEIQNKHYTQEGDILLCARSGSANLVGKNIYIGSETSGLTFGAFMVVVRSSVGKYLHLILNSSLFESQRGLFSTSTINQLTSDTLNNIDIVFPAKLEEQNSIIIYIENETNRIDSTISKIEKEIDLLQEYRTALISEVVTGKIKVI